MDLQKKDNRLNIFLKRYKILTCCGVNVKKLLMKFEEKNPKLFEIFKFLIVGGFATIIDMLAMAVVLYVFDPKLYEYNFLNTVIGNQEPSDLVAVLGTGVGFILGLIFNYIFSIIFVFTSSNTYPFIIFS